MGTAGDSEGRVRFELIERLGRGGAGSVWRARLWGRHGITRSVAIKVVEAGDEGLLARVRDEARLLGLLQHRALVQVQDLVELEGGRWGLVMELLEGVDLQGLAATGPVPFGVVLDIAVEIADALDCALRTPDLEGRPLGLTHRDIKPANLLMTLDGRVKLLDFGVARANLSTREAVTLQGEVWGTLGYMSPERLHGADTPSADIYALGVVLYELSLRQRFGHASLLQSDHEDRLAEVRRRLSAARAPEPFIELIERMMAFDLGARPSAYEVRDRARAIRAVTPEPPLAGWASRVVPCARHARLSRLGSPEPGGDIWSAHPAASVPPFVPRPPASRALSTQPLPELPELDAPIQRPRRLPWIAAGAFAAALCLMAALRLMPPERPPLPGPPQETASLVNTTEPETQDSALWDPGEVRAAVVRVSPSPPRRAVAAVVEAPEAAPIAPEPAEPPPPTTVIVSAPATPDRLGVVQLSGPVVEAMARSDAGEWRLPGAVPEGTYAVMARFDDGALELAGVVHVSADRSTRLSCEAATRSCAARASGAPEVTATPTPP